MPLHVDLRLSVSATSTFWNVLDRVRARRGPQDAEQHRAALRGRRRAHGLEVTLDVARSSVGIAASGQTIEIGAGALLA